MRGLLHSILLTAVFSVLLIVPARALEYTIDTPENYL